MPDYFDLYSAYSLAFDGPTIEQKQAHLINPPDSVHSKRPFIEKGKKTEENASPNYAF
jgi:hypothetical protein